MLSQVGAMLPGHHRSLPTTGAVGCGPERALMFDMQVIVRLLCGWFGASITLHITHYAARQGEGDLRSPA
jgi:hypothetical protein